MLDMDPDIAHQQLIEARKKRDNHAAPDIEIMGTKRRSGISARKTEMLVAVLDVVYGLKEYWPLSDRQIHYGLLNNPPLRNNSKGSHEAGMATTKEATAIFATFSLGRDWMA